MVKGIKKDLAEPFLIDKTSGGRGKSEILGERDGLFLDHHLAAFELIENVVIGDLKKGQNTDGGKQKTQQQRLEGIRLLDQILFHGSDYSAVALRLIRSKTACEGFLRW